MSPRETYVALLSRDANDYVLVSDHPAIGILHWPHCSTLERSARAVIDRLDDDVELRYGPGLGPSIDDEDLLRADNPTAAFQTVPGTERLPATDRTERGDGLDVQQDDPPTQTWRDRHPDRVRVVALGQVHAPH